MKIRELIARLIDEAIDDPDIIVECYNPAGDVDYVKGIEVYHGYGKRRLLITTELQPQKSR